MGSEQNDQDPMVPLTEEAEELRLQLRPLATYLKAQGHFMEAEEAQLVELCAYMRAALRPLLEQGLPIATICADLNAPLSFIRNIVLTDKTPRFEIEWTQDGSG